MYPIRPILPPINISKPMSASIKGNTFKNPLTKAGGIGVLANPPEALVTNPLKLGMRTKPCISILMPRPMRNRCIALNLNLLVLICQLAIRQFVNDSQVIDKLPNS